MIYIELKEKHFLEYFSGLKPGHQAYALTDLSFLSHKATPIGGLHAKVARKTKRTCVTKLRLHFNKMSMVNTNVRTV